MIKAHDERGSGLILALVMLSVIGLLITAVLGFGFSSIKTAETIRDQGKRIYAADAGIEYTIEQIRSNEGAGLEGGPCDELFPPPPNVNGKNISIQCTGLANSGEPVEPQNHPGSAILALSTNSGETPIEYQGEGVGAQLNIKGAVRSNGDVTASGQGNLNVDGPVRARGACTPLAQVLSSDRRCSNTTIPYVRPLPFPAPNYLSELGESPTIPGDPPSFPQCPSGQGWLVEFFGGRYDDVVALNKITGTGGCSRNPIVWFHPGVYYFSFGDDAPVWNIKKAMTIVGGTITVNGTITELRPSDPVPLVGAAIKCQKPTSETSTEFIPGVQFIFEGMSRVEMTQGSMELCPTINPAAPAS